MRMRGVFLFGLVLSGAMIVIDASGGPPSVIAKPPQLQAQTPTTPATPAPVSAIGMRVEVQRELAARLTRLREDQKTKLGSESKAAANDALKPSPPPLTSIVQKRAADLKTSRDASAGIDFSKMPMEDAVVMMFFMISADAKQDMKDLLEKMDATRKDRASLEDAHKAMREKVDELKSRMTELRIKQLTERELQLKKEYEARRDLEAKASEAANNLLATSSKADAG
jgi:hypothetical protein